MKTLGIITLVLIIVVAIGYFALKWFFGQLPF